MHRFVAARAPATPPLQERRVVPSPDEDHIVRGLLLEVTFEAQVLVALNQHFVVHRSVRVVAGGASFTDCFMLKHKWTALSDVASGTGFVL